MTARTTATAVKLIIATTLTDDQINAFIQSANLLVTNRCADQGMSDELLTEIETWLAAHLLSMRDQRTEGRSIGDVSFNYQGQTGFGLDATTYGQQVKLLDVSGRLASAGMRQASVTTFTEYDDDG